MVRLSFTNMNMSVPVTTLIELSLIFLYSATKTFFQGKLALPSHQKPTFEYIFLLHGKVIIAIIIYYYYCN